jgi:hypothetical protein
LNQKMMKKFDDFSAQLEWSELFETNCIIASDYDPKYVKIKIK